ncbi:MAG: DUF1501 domain-containing protein [Acetobacteraceae bacterium]|nr:DUF1501 domain-containing protein [Acetobacteraceae bacterium]
MTRIPRAATTILTRRGVLLGLSTAIALGPSALALADAPTERRFVVVILRGALDGLSAVPPYGDRLFRSLRTDIAPPDPGEPEGALDLGGFYGLHPALANLHALFAGNELLVVHAVAGGYRSRSHFEAQDCLESGADHRMTSGWLNRAVSAMRPQRSETAAGEALAIGVSVPLLLRGVAPVSNWAPPVFSPPPPDLYATIAALNRTDPITGPAIAEGLRERGFSAEALAGTDPAAGQRFAFRKLAAAAGLMLRAGAGPRIAALELGGWDTHADQKNRLALPLRELDAGLAALKEGLGDAWRQTAVLVMTEFGRTVAVNGTKGTDHGTGTVAFVLGGAVAGGRTLADWPGLANERLLDRRDLQPTTDLRAIAKGLLAQHLGLTPSELATVFPASGNATPTGGLIRA